MCSKITEKSNLVYNFKSQMYRLWDWICTFGLLYFQIILDFGDIYTLVCKKVVKVKLESNKKPAN